MVRTMDAAQWRGRPALCDVLDRVMPVSDLLAVALLNDRPADRLARGQVGTIVEYLADGAVLVEFSDDEGRAYAIVPCAPAALIALHYLPQPA